MKTQLQKLAPLHTEISEQYYMANLNGSNVRARGYMCYLGAPVAPLRYGEALYEAFVSRMDGDGRMRYYQIEMPVTVDLFNQLDTFTQL